MCIRDRFTGVFGPVGGIILTLCLVLFATTTILGSVSYTHLDVYKRQGLFDRPRDWNLYALGSPARKIGGSQVSNWSRCDRRRDNPLGDPDGLDYSLNSSHGFHPK